MISPRRAITIVGTLACALGIGFLMQNTLRQPGTQAREGTVQVASAGAMDVLPEAQAGREEILPVPMDAVAQAELLTAGASSAVPMPPMSAPQPETLPGRPVALAALDDQPINAPLPQEEPAPAFGCEPAMTAQPMAAAMVRLTLEAPCMSNERFTLHHNGMMFSAVTDDAGRAELSVPALSAAAVFIATFDSGDSVVATADVGTLEYYDRAVVQWRGDAGLQIHALEYGADYGQPGHVWAGAARDMADAARGEGGFITRLGDSTLPDALMAEVYTFPTRTAPKGGDVSLSLEAEVTRGNCGQKIEAQVLQKHGLEKMTVHDLSMAMPDFDATGDFLVLKNLLDDLKIAGN